jgi:hypothetical protein
VAERLADSQEVHSSMESVSYVICVKCPIAGLINAKRSRPYVIIRLLSLKSARIGYGIRSLSSRTRIFETSLESVLCLTLSMGI